VGGQNPGLVAANCLNGLFDRRQKPTAIFEAFGERQPQESGVSLMQSGLASRAVARPRKIEIEIVAPFRDRLREQLFSVGHDGPESRRIGQGLPGPAVSDRSPDSLRGRRQHFLPMRRVQVAGGLLFFRRRASGQHSEVQEDRARNTNLKSKKLHENVPSARDALAALAGDRAGFAGGSQPSNYPHVTRPASESQENALCSSRSARVGWALPTLP